MAGRTPDWTPGETGGITGRVSRAGCTGETVTVTRITNTTRETPGTTGTPGTPGTPTSRTTETPGITTRDLRHITVAAGDRRIPPVRPTVLHEASTTEGLAGRALIRTRPPDETLRSPSLDTVTPVTPIIRTKAQGGTCHEISTLSSIISYGGINTGYYNIFM